MNKIKHREIDMIVALDNLFTNFRSEKEITLQMSLSLRGVVFFDHPKTKQLTFSCAQKNSILCVTENCDGWNTTEEIGRQEFNLDNRLDIECHIADMFNI